MDSSPRVSVVIRSYERGGALIELIEAVLGQRGVASFEIVVVEQSRRLSAAHIARLDELWRTAGVRILKRPPLGGPGARNAGTRAARGEILVFMDDDDLPADDHWLAAHLANFDDPNCLAVTGRQLLPERPGQPYRNMARAREQVCSFVPILMWQRCFTAADQRRVVDNVHGGNVSIRRSTL
ncbi:MAG: glycosyltransferase family 2 protein, partial [Kofleriaceae bacterium]